MSGFIPEALAIGVKEGAKLAVCAALLVSLARARRREHLAGPAAAALAVVLFASFAVMRFPVTVELRSAVAKLVGYVFGVSYLLSLGALYQATGTDILGPLKRIGENRVLSGIIVFLSVILYFLPDMAGASLYLTDLAAMQGRRLPVLAAAAAGFGGAAICVFVILERRNVLFDRMFGVPQALLFLALMKLLFGGIRGFTEFSLIPSVQAGLIKLVHDVVHQLFVFLMVPDHPVLTTTAWNTIGALFGETAGLWLSLAVITLPLLLFIWKQFHLPVDIPRDVALPARRRMFLRMVQDQRIQRATPIALFLLVIMVLWFGQRGGGGQRLYLPEPRPVAAVNGMVQIPLQSTLEDLRDGMAHKFTVASGDEVIRLLVMQKPDGTLAACLDACEVCEPQGYGQSKEHVVCLYCNTPIPFDTVGRPGGCNPVPLKAMVTDTQLEIALDHIIDAWERTKSADKKEVKE